MSAELIDAIPDVIEFIANNKELVACLSLPVFAMAFSKAVRMKIGQRDRWECQECGKDFKSGWMVHASHYNHDQGDPDYDSEYSGEILCVDCHQDYHVEHQDNPEDIGLTRKQNNWAIHKLMNTDRRTRDYRNRNGG